MNLDELAKRLVRCKHFRWKPGMLFRHARGWCRVVSPTQAVWESNEDPYPVEVQNIGGLVTFMDIEAHHRPELSDPATLGCLLHLVRDAWGWEGITTLRASAPSFDGAWRVETMRAVQRLPRLKWFATEAEALVAALEAAP
jgi:hypothetical protein